MSEKYTKLLKDDINNLTSFQKDYHYPVSVDKNGKPIDTDVAGPVLPFVVQKDKPIPYINYNIISKFSKDEDNNIIYFKAVDGYHYLNRSILEQYIQPLKLRKDYRNKYEICWTDNLINHIIYKGELLIEKNTVSTKDSIILNSKLTEPISDSEKELYTWATELPEKTLELSYPFFYNEGNIGDYAIPIKRNNIEIIHKFYIRNQIKDLIKVRERKGEDYILLSKDIITEDFLREILETNKLTLGYPIFECSYSLVDENTYNNESKTDDTIWYIDTIDKYKSKNLLAKGKNDDITITSNRPVTKFYFVVQSIEALKHNCYSNYTDNIFDPNESKKEMIEKYFLETQNYTMPTMNDNQIYNRNYKLAGEKKPTVKGIGIHSLTSKNDYMPTGIVFNIKNPATLKFNIKEPSYTENTSEKYIIHIRIDIINKIIFKADGSIIIEEFDDDKIK